MSHWMLHMSGGPPICDCTAAVFGDEVYTFYWSSYMIYVNIFNTVSLRWRMMTAGSGELQPEVPSYRIGHSFALVDYIIYMWGGRQIDTSGCNVLYAFDVDTHRWFTPMVRGNVPQARCFHSAVVLGKVMYIHGGAYIRGSGKTWTNEIIKLGTATMVWSLINPRGSPSPAYRYHSATNIGTEMFVFGRYMDKNEVCNNISVFDTETNSWMNTPSAQIIPEYRLHSAFAYNGELYIFATKHKLDKICDLWKLNGETFSWKKVETKGESLSNGKWDCCCNVRDRIILLSGENHLSILDLNPSLKTLCKLAVIQYGLEQAGLTHDVRWELAAMTTNSN